MVVCVLSLGAVRALAFGDLPKRPAGLRGHRAQAGPVARWHEVFADDFNGSALDRAKWRLYEGQPGGDRGAWFDPRHVAVSHGELVISGYRDGADGGKFATGGVSSSPGLVQTYGKYLVRMRFDDGRGVSHILLLWPADNSWPPEIDFSEDSASGRQLNYATLHYGADDTQVQRKLTVNPTKWHVYGVVWTPGKLAFTLDGRPWANITGSAVPSVPMVLDIQTQSWACGVSSWEGCVGAATPRRVNLYVDWVVAYSLG